MLAPRNLNSLLHNNDTERPRPKHQRNRSLGSLTKRGTNVTSNQNIFITQTSSKKDLHDDKAATFESFAKQGANSNSNNITDTRIKGVLGRLNATMDRLKKASDSCEKMMGKSLSGMLYPKHSRSSTFALTQTNYDSLLHNASASKSSTMVAHFLSMNETDFISNQTALAINQAAQSIDLNPMSGMFTENMWTHISEGMNYSNELRYEIARKLKHLEQLKRQEEDLNKDLDMAPLKERIEELKSQIEKANERVETVEIQQESLCYMINVKRKDNLIGWQKFQKQYKPLQWANKAIEKQLDEIMTMDKMLQKQGGEFKTIQQQYDENLKDKIVISSKRGGSVEKIERLERNLELEHAYKTKRNELIQKNKKEIEREKQYQIETQQRLARKKEEALFELLTNFEDDLGKIAAVSKKYPNKEDYLTHLEELEQNNQDLLNKIQTINEEIELKNTIEIPTLKAELEQLKKERSKINQISDKPKLRKILQVATKRNEDCEKTVAYKQGLLVNATRGIMTLFYRLLSHKNEIGLEKLDEVQLKNDNLGDVLLLCGDILETIKNIGNEPSVVKSHPMSQTEFFEED